MRYEHCYKCKTEVTYYSFFVNFFQAGFKSILGVLYGSTALVADGLHSSADVIASLVTMVSIKISSKSPNERYAYGFGNIQFISASIVGGILILGAFYLFVGAVLNIYHGTYHAPNKIAILGAVVSIILNQMLFRYQSCVGRENNSPAIMANAWDNRSDAMSSLAVLIGIIFATFGFPIADPIGAMGVSILIVRIGIELVTDSFKGLIDHSPDIAELQEVYQTVIDIPGVLNILSLKLRRSGELNYVDIGIKVDSDLKIYEGDLIALAVKMGVKEAIEESEVQVFLGV
ncbi:MAG: magnetosome biogenesis CDF transporter MamB [SAR324 cluster bacterium]|nr:magnetosome biogenesis CDF transporter MamB [SAR324 cluster bacterium]